MSGVLTGAAATNKQLQIFGCCQRFPRIELARCLNRPKTHTTVGSSASNTAHGSPCVPYIKVVSLVDLVLEAVATCPLLIAHPHLRIDRGFLYSCSEGTLTLHVLPKRWGTTMHAMAHQIFHDSFPSCVRHCQICVLDTVCVFLSDCLEMKSNSLGRSSISSTKTEYHLVSKCIACSIDCFVYKLNSVLHAAHY